MKKYLLMILFKHNMRDLCQAQPRTSAGSTPTLPTARLSSRARALDLARLTGAEQRSAAADVSRFQRPKKINK